MVILISIQCLYGSSFHKELHRYGAYHPTAQSKIQNQVLGDDYLGTKIINIQLQKGNKYIHPRIYTDPRKVVENLSVRVSYSGYPMLYSFEIISNEINFLNSFPLFTLTLIFEL